MNHGHVRTSVNVLLYENRCTCHLHADVWSAEHMIQLSNAHSAPYRRGVSLQVK